ncbi:MAG: hypothetical protein JXR80_06930 [Deltaproteobacteria bacterium]|nr:hypothetical protein [Deltaproteobacteria bacterium]
MTKRKFILSIVSVFLFATPIFFSPPLQAAGPWQGLTQAIQSHLNQGNQAVGNITLIQGQTAIINLLDPQLTIGSTLAVKGNSLPGVPLPLQDNIASLRLIQINGNQARATILPGSRTTPVGAPLFPLAHNRVYLYTNLTTPQTLPPYQDLTRALQFNRIPFAVKSWEQISAGDIPGIRPLIVAFEAAGSLITCRLTDRDQNIFFQNSFTLNFAPPSYRPAGANWSAPAPAVNVTPSSESSSRSFTQAAGPAPGTTPAGSIKLKTPYKRLVFADYDSQPGQELILLSDQGLEVYRLQELKTIPIARYRLPYNDMIPLHLDAGDFNHNGRDELYLTLGRPLLVDGKADTKLSSIILENDNSTLKPLGKDYPHYFRVIEQRDGKQVLLVQDMDQYKQYKLPIRWGGYYNGKFSVQKEFAQARDVFSLYNFNLSPFNPEHILIIDEEGNVAGFNGKTSEKLITADNKYGVFDETAYPQKLKSIEYQGGFSLTKSSEIRFSARRFVKRNSYGEQIFLIKKDRVVMPDLVDKGLSLVVDEGVKHDQVIGLQWRNGEIHESWKSPKFPRDIVDFAFTSENGKEVMVILTRNQDGKYSLELLH